MLQNAELIGLEDEVDSAVPLSPYSFHSGDPSPNPVMAVGVSAAAVSRSLAAKGAPNNVQHGNIVNGTNAVLNGWSPTMEQRPKAFSVRIHFVTIHVVAAVVLIISTKRFFYFILFYFILFSESSQHVRLEAKTP